MNISISSTFVDEDAETLVRSVIDEVDHGRLCGTHISTVVSTRAMGEHPTTDGVLSRLKIDYPHIPFLRYSARTHGRLRNNDTEGREVYDRAILEELRDSEGRLPSIHVMLGDMIIKGETWCRELPSLNLHPDVPLSLGGTEGIYWDVIGEWVRSKRTEIGGMMHLAIPTLDAGTPVSYFRLPARGTINGVDLRPLWELLPEDEATREKLIAEQTTLRDKPTHRLFQALRAAEAAFENELVLGTLRMFAEGELVVEDGVVVGSDGRELRSGLDVTEIAVGRHAIRPEVEGSVSQEGHRNRGVEF